MAPSCVSTLVLPWLCQGHLCSPRQPSSHLTTPSLPSALLLFLGIRPAAPARARARLTAACSPFHPQPYRSISWPFHSLLCPPCPWTGHTMATRPRALPGSVGPAAHCCQTHCAPQHPLSMQHPGPLGAPTPCCCTPHPGSSLGTLDRHTLGKALPFQQDFSRTPSPPAGAATARLRGKARRATLRPGTVPVSPGTLSVTAGPWSRSARGRAALPEPLSPRGTRRGSGAYAAPPRRCAGSPGTGARSSARPPRSAATP